MKQFKVEMINLRNIISEQNYLILNLNYSKSSKKIIKTAAHNNK